MNEPPQPPRTPQPGKPDCTTPVLRALGAGDRRPPTPAPLDATLAPPTSNAGDLPTLTPPPPNWLQPGGLAGQTFGDFELLAEVGRGGMGVVYKAIQKSLDRPVALKLLLAEHACNPHLLLRFLAEARAAASLTHPNIISIYQVGECPAGPYFVMEFIDGPSLEDLLERPLPVHWSTALLITVAEAVQHAHDRGIVHRDLKPGNIMLQQQKRPVVMDFGIAKMMGHGQGNLTGLGALIGTPAYMPPEQAGEEPSKVGPHSDVYSLGAILYTLLTGQIPYDEGSALKTLMRVVSDKPPQAIRSLRPEVPARLEQIVAKAMQKDPARRYPSAHTLADDLRRFRAGQQTKPGSGSLRVPQLNVVLVAKGGQQTRLVRASTVIGRAAECDLVIKASEISKRHCRILLGQAEAVVEDLGSINGVFVNGQQVQRGKLADGDELDIAGHVFTVRIVPGQ
jgi:serine/threonine protein kinase